MQVVYDKDDVKNVAYGPPGMDPKLWKIEVVKQDSQGDVTEVINVGDVSEEMESESRNLIGEVDSELSFEITNKKTLSEYCNTKLKNEVTSELSSDKQLNVQANSKVALSYDNDDSSEIHKSSTSSLLLNKKLRAYSNMSKRNRSLSGSDTSNKDSSSVSDTNSCLEKDVNDDVRDVIKRIAEQYKVIPSVKNKKKQNDVTPTRLKINVNPFKNIDPNISVFVDKLVAPILLVHTKKNKRIQPIFEMRDVFFNSHIHIVLKNMLIEHPMMVQSVSWNTILRGHSLFMISPPNSGKTLGYLPAVCRLISDVYTGNVDSVGPLCIIVCATAKSVTIVEEMAKMFLGLDDKILASKKTPDTVISFSAFQECVPYSKADTSVSFVEIENKINMVFEFLQGIDESKKTNGNPNSVLVNLIDEEKYEITRDIYLYYLPEELKEIKTPVVQVRLANVEPKDKDITFSNLAVEQFKKITDNNDLFIKGHVSLTLGNCVFVDTLEVCQELTSLNETVVKNNLKQELLENHAQLNPERLQQLKKLCTESGICYTEIVKEPEIQNPVKNLPKGSWAHLESGILSTVFLSSAKSPDKFFVRLNKFESCMSVLLQDIKEYSEAYISNNELSKVKEGDLVLAEFPDDSTYERARIDGINDDKAKCFFLDQGDWIEIPMEHIIPITEKFINKLPFQAIECRLIGIEPPGEEWSDFSKNWFCNNCFEDKNGDLKHLYIKYFTKEAAEFTGGYKYGVALIDTNTPNDVVINQLMIDLNLAKENIKEREYLNKLLPDAKESGHEQTFEEENSYLNLHPDTNESDHVETFEEVENEDDDEKMTKINQDRVLYFERWDVNLDQSVLSTLFPRINSNIQAKVTQDTDDDVSTDENQVIPFRSRETNTEVNIQIKQNDPQELDSDDFTSSETSQTFNVCNDKQNLLSVVEQKRRPKLLWRQTKNVVFVKIELIAVKEYDLEFDVRNLKFSCNLNDATYEFDIELYGVIDRDKSSHLKTGFNIIVKLVKVLKTKWVSLTKSFDTKNWIAYDADSIDTSSDEEEVDRSTMENIIKVMHGTDDESDDDEFLDDVNYEYGKHN
ncbi:putative ATP-dependent RNA helicase TDRD12 [Nymphalis io]|uniref:putative ATP-dependent RNA helicase TDRD12 n=1 Tax=Inachis io TaxID=171585 RepID=UPI00216A77C2|nr:putative ATP-dependent RNA helicase TDRD12 [Nymphalis io]